LSLAELVLPLRRGLAGLRRRVRSLLLVLGLSRSALFLTGALVAFFLADYFLRLPLSVRTVLLLALLGGTVIVVVRRLVMPLSARLTDEMLAGRVEAAHPDLRDRLRSSLAFAGAAGDPDNEDSPELMRVVVEETVRQAGAIPFARVARTRTTLRWTIAAAALVLVVVTAALSRPAVASTFVQRALLLRDVSWPRRTTLTVVDMAPGTPRRVTLGRETTVQIRAEGSLPDRVRFSFWERGRGPLDADMIELTPSAEDPALFAFTLKVYTSYAFTVAGGDDDRELVYSIDALTPPAVLGIEMDAKYPPYLGLPDATLRGGGQRLPEDTHVRLRVRTNMEVARATIALGAEEPRALEALAPDVYTTEIVAEKNVRYSLRLVGRNGEENDPGVDTYLIQVIHDQPPGLRVRTPSAHTERLASGVLLIALTARDDHRIEAVSLRYRLNDEEERTVALGEAGGDAIRILAPEAHDPTRLDAVVAFDLSHLRRKDGKLVERGDRLLYDFDAVDSAGHTRHTRSPYRLEIVAEEDVTQALQGRQRELKDAVRSAETRAQDAASKRELAGDTRGDPQEFRRWNQLAQAAQARVSDSLEGVSRRVREVLNVLVFNRLDDPSAADQILPFYERHLLQASDDGNVPFGPELYRDLFTAMSERRIRVGDAHRKLIEMADLADRLATEHAPRAYRALGRIPSAPDDAAILAALAEARTEQRIILDGLARLNQLMREWESYEGVVRWFKGLRDKEKEIVEGLRSEEK